MSDLQESQPNTTKNTELKGLDGWLIWVGISVIITPIRLLPNFFTEAELVWTSVSWNFLFNPEVESILRLTSYLLIFEFTYGTILMSLLLVQIYLFFTKHKKFPAFFIGILILFLIFKPIARKSEMIVASSLCPRLNNRNMRPLNVGCTAHLKLNHSQRSHECPSNDAPRCGRGNSVFDS